MMRLFLKSLSHLIMLTISLKTTFNICLHSINEITVIYLDKDETCWLRLGGNMPRFGFLPYAADQNYEIVSSASEVILCC